MKKYLPHIIILLLVAVLASCSGSKSYYKKGQKLEENGLKVEAADFYIESVKRKRTNENAIIALKKLGQNVLDEKFSSFYKLYSDDRFRDAVYAYLDANSFKNRVAAVGVQLNSAPYYKDYYEEAREKYITVLYDEAQGHLQNEDFQKAESTLNEIKKLDPTYKNVNALSDFAFVEPKYREALKAYDAHEFRTAYFLFDEINQRTNTGYEESIDYQKLALESAQYTVAILPVEHDGADNNLASGISGSLISQIKNLDDPFLRLIDRSVQNQIEAEQYRNLSSSSGASAIIKSGEYFGTKALLVGKIINSTSNQGRLQKQSKTGWQGKEVKYVDKATGEKRTTIVYDKVYYYEYSQVNKVSCTFQYQLISTESGEVLLSDIVKVTKQDEMNYASYSGDARLLVPGYWRNQFKKETSDRRYDSYSQKRELKQKLEAKKTIEDVNVLSKYLIDDIGRSVAVSVKSFNPENK